MKIVKGSKIHLLFIGFAVVLGIIIFTRINCQKGGVSKKDRKAESLFMKVKDRELKSLLAKPKEYNVTMSTVRNQDMSQMQIDFQTKEEFVGSKVLNVMQEQGAFDGLLKTQDKYNKKIERIDQRIENYQQQLKKDPGNEQLKKGIVNLYHMRSILINLEEAVVQ